MTNSFANHPPSIGELRSEKTESAADWTPRDVLIAMLRDIDKGDLKLETLVVVGRRVPQSPAVHGRVSYWVSSSDHLLTTGLLYTAMHDLEREQHE